MSKIIFNNIFLNKKHFKKQLLLYSQRPSIYWLYIVFETTYICIEKYI